MQFVAGTYDVIVIGAGHAGVEAALAAARMGERTLLATLSMDNIALMPCNPSVGGPAKGHLVREVDALGGEMGVNADKTCIQFRMLNTGKGPAVHALRAQADKKLYQFTMKETCENTENLDVKQILITDLLLEDIPEDNAADASRTETDGAQAAASFAPKKRVKGVVVYNDVPSLRDEAREKLAAIRPQSLGQASRISGVSPADVSVLAVWMEQQRRLAAHA